MKTLWTKLGKLLCSWDIHWFQHVERRVFTSGFVDYDACTRCSKMRSTRGWF